MMDISIPYYEDRTRISNSNIGWFLNKGPAFLHKMLTDPPPEEKNPVLERGTMVHMFLLQPEEFQKTYVVWDKSRPTSAQQEKFCQELANTVEIEPNRAILSAYKEAYSTAGKSEDKMLSEGLKIASTLKDYIDFLKENDGRIMISPWDAQMLEKIKQNIQSHKLAWRIINTQGTVYESIDSNKRVEWGAHEFHINWECRGVQCKSLLDGLTLDFKNKKAIIYDLKTTQKLWHFEDSIDQYDYLRQLCYYKKAVLWYLENEYEEDPLTWDFEFYIIGIDTTGSYEIRTFYIDEHTVNSRLSIIHDALDKIAWHQSTDKWDHSREYYEGNGSESLNL
ncbi:MAG: PD-(D/E)XK nuclease-like domain-containing protein [Aeriscardovia sp.]|nr:PD-(D/E)XK nuclease-like domain-containing protein [Aeriscardovia sp.]